MYESTNRMRQSDDNAAALLRQRHFIHHSELTVRDTDYSNHQWREPSAALDWFDSGFAGRRPGVEPVWTQDRTPPVNPPFVRSETRSSPDRAGSEQPRNLY